MHKIESKTARMLPTIVKKASNDFEGTLMVEMTKSHKTREMIPGLQRGEVMRQVRDARNHALGRSGNNTAGYRPIDGAPRAPRDESLGKRATWAMQRTVKVTGG